MKRTRLDLLLVERGLAESRSLAQRRSIRLKGYDYSLPGAYFVTLVTREHKSLFGEISAGMMHCNRLGEITQAVWQNLTDFFSIQLDEWIIMPNHLHGIIWITDTQEGEASANENLRKSLSVLADASPLRTPYGTQHGSLGAVIQNFKSLSTRKIHQWLGRGEAFAGGKIDSGSATMANASPKQVWQRNYYDRIIRDDKELDRIRLYIIENPRLWAEDPENLL